MVLLYDEIVAVPQAAKMRALLLYIIKGTTSWAHRAGWCTDARRTRHSFDERSRRWR